MDKNDWIQWKEYTLIPALFGNVDRIFPNMGFHLVNGGRKWITSLRFDGSTSKKKDKLYITSEKPHLIGVNGKGKGRRVIDFYMEQSGKDFSSATKELASICGVDYPQGDSEAWKAYEQEQENRKAANELFKAALFSDDEGARETLEYLKERKWSEEEIREAELGYITTEILTSLPIQGSCKASNKKDNGEWESIGTTHRLTIPFQNGSRILGFKVRNIHHTKEDKEQGGVKYLNTRGLNRTYLFGLLPKGKDCIVVEGELDALHAKAKASIAIKKAEELLEKNRDNEEARRIKATAEKIQNIAATAGGKLTLEMIKDAKDRKYKRFTLLFDADNAGAEFTESSIEALKNANVDIWIATLPKGYKDLDEYLGDHSLEDFNDIIEKAFTSDEWELHQAALRYFDDIQGDKWTRKREEDFIGEVEKIVNSPSLVERPINRQLVKQYIKDNEEFLNVKWEDIEAWIEQRFNRLAAKKRISEANSAAQRISQLMGEGKVDEALALMKETSQSLKAVDQAEEFSKVFAPLSWGEYTELLKTIPKGLPTGFRIGGEELTLNAGITFVCASTGHCKTTFLNNLILNEAKRNKDLGNGKSVVYFSLEIDKRRLIADLINAYVNDPELHTERAQNPLFAIYSYFERSGAKDAFRSEAKYKKFEETNKRFFSEYISTGAIRVVDKNYLIGELISALRYLLTITTPSAIFIDYAQLIYKEGQSRQRTEEIKEIVNEIKNFANENGLPIVLAAQFNRQVDSPLSVVARNIGEGGDFERIADTIIGIYKLDDKDLGKSMSDSDKKALAELLNYLLLRNKEASLKIEGTKVRPIPDHLYVKLLKRRYGRSGEEQILSWKGTTKHIEPNFPQALRVDYQEAASQDYMPSSSKPENNSLPF